VSFVKTHGQEMSGKILAIFFLWNEMSGKMLAYSFLSFVVSFKRNVEWLNKNLELLIFSCAFLVQSSLFLLRYSNPWNYFNHPPSPIPTLLNFPKYMVALW
jgi:hypothetical protein